MTKNLIFLLFVFFISISCSDEDIFKTTTQEYASKKGKFIAKFPQEPELVVIENKVGLTEYSIFRYGLAYTPNKNFSVEYLDYQPKEIEPFTDDELYNKAIENTLFSLKNQFKIQYQENIVQHGLKGKTYILEFKDKSKREIGFIFIKLFRVKNRIYSVIYQGRDDRNIDPFMKSFRLLK